MADLASTRIFGKLTVMHDAHINGDLTTDGTVNGSSDSRLKADVAVIEDALSKVGKLRGYTYVFRADPTRRHTGVIAQEVKDVIPEAVREREDGYLTVAYGNLVGLLIEAINEGERRRESLESRIEELEKNRGNS
jgi:hypothetical protein